MEEVHHQHKETAWGWVAALDQWRRTRARRRLRPDAPVVTAWAARPCDDRTA
ncbi:hypothetical protein ACIQC9_00865 [Brevundimonas sp. NPDC092305]|uniref:hypothetical protein n=1 Tax=Brevundimonas sp. NPDC092305 TaxID=3363957 RepID=UPI00380BF9B4